MQFIIKCVAVGVLFLTVQRVHAQSAFLPQGHKHQAFLDRLEILMQKNSDLNVNTIKPQSRKHMVLAVERADSLNKAGQLALSKVDKWNLQSFLMNNAEWVSGSKSGFVSKKPVWNSFYKNKADFFQVDEKDFFLAVNPVIQQQQSLENDADERTFLNSKGVSLRGLIAKKVGFSAFITDNQERGPAFAMARINEQRAVQGVGFYKTFKQTAVDYFDGRGSIYFNAAKYIDISFGYDKQVIGNGYRSMLLSDFGNSYLYLKLNTRIWKFSYQNIYKELTPTFVRGATDQLLDKKYAAIHHLSLNVTPWLNLGLFEAVVFGRKNKFDFMYLNPIMFLRIAEQQTGSADNALVGFDFKANVAKRLQFYGQFLFDEFKLDELRSGNGWWANKFAIQAGGKYINAFGVANLDLQGEINMARPFMYTHFDSVSSYTHHNQPLAHPFGANFREFVGLIRYQPHPKWTASGRLILWQQGVDTAGGNLGNDIFALNNTRSMQYGYTLPTGPTATGVNGQFLLTYEWKENLMLDFSTLLRSWDPGMVSQKQNTAMFTLGVRMNMYRREYDY